MGLLLCKWWMTLWLTALHPFYASVTEISHNAATKKLQVSCHIFTDDLENALKAANKTPVDITQAANRRQAEGYIASYLSQHLTITVNGKQVPLHFTGYKIEEDAVWSFLEAEQVPVPNTMQVKNNLLYEMHAAQMNMIHVLVGGERKSAKLDNPKDKVVMKF